MLFSCRGVKQPQFEQLMFRVGWVCDGFAAERSLALLVSGYRVLCSCRGVKQPRCEQMMFRVGWVCDGFAAGRSLALLVSGYRVISALLLSRCEAASIRPAYFPA